MEKFGEVITFIEQQQEWALEKSEKYRELRAKAPMPIDSMAADRKVAQADAMYNAFEDVRCFILKENEGGQ